MINNYIYALVDYAQKSGLISEYDKVYTINRILEALNLLEFEKPYKVEHSELEEILDGILSFAIDKAIINDTITERDLFDTKIMGLLTPTPSNVIEKFNKKLEVSPKDATDYYYNLSCASNYIRTARVKRDMKWKVDTDYGEIDITINLSKPEKDPKAIAAEKNAAKCEYPKCMLCRECEGYSGRLNYPARQNHRIIPITINNSDWCLQYSPYVYYNEHCIVFNAQHTPMSINHDTFKKLFDFVKQFPHYFVGSNADLPIVGGSILSHDHFQGGRYTFAMANAQIETPIKFNGFEDVEAGIVKWPMSVIRLRGTDTERINELGIKILDAWRRYTDESAFIFAKTDNEPHNTITPIARCTDGVFELDLVLRNNITTDEHPLGVYHPHKELHHIKKENIGLIEVMGLAVLPSRLKNEISEIKDILISGKEMPSTNIHSDWVAKLRGKYDEFTPDNTEDILRLEIGEVFKKVLEHAGVYKRTPDGKEAFLRFVDYVNQK